MVLGLRCDLTRTMSFMLDQASGQKRYPGGPDSGDHDTSHKQDESATRSATNAKLSYLANFLRDCAAVKEGDRTMLDSMVVYSNSDVNDGNAHDRDKTLPIVIAGHAGGALKGGRHVRFPSATPLNDLLSSLLNYCEVPTGKFGSQGSGPLGGL